MATLAIALAPLLALFASGCTDGTTPDCSAPDAGCAPDLTAHLPEASPFEAGDADGARDGAADRTGDGGDGGGDAPNDAVDERDADAARDAPRG